MADARLRFSFQEPTIDTNRPITEGTVKVPGFELVVVGDQEEADAWDFRFAALVRSKAGEHPYVSIPAFPNRKFRLSYIYVNAASGIQGPRDLEGKTVGIPFWVNTAGVWIRGALEHYYGVHLNRIRWVALRLDMPEPLPGVHIEKCREGSDLDAMLVSGELDAVIDPNVLPSISRRDSRVRRLFLDYKTEEQAYFKKTGIFPISHVVTLSRDFVERHPNAPVAVLQAFRQARDLALERIQGADPEVLLVSWASALLDEQRALMGDNYWAYNIDNNRVVLEAMTQYAFEQGLTPKRIDFLSLFAPDAAALSGG